MSVAGMQTIQPGAGMNALSLHPAITSAAPAGTPRQIRHEQLQHTAQRWVAQTFFGTLLKQIRNSPFKSEVLSGGRGGEAFGTLYDQHLADRMASACGRRLAQSIVRHLERSRTDARDGSADTAALKEGGDVAATR